MKKFERLVRSKIDPKSNRLTQTVIVKDAKAAEAIRKWLNKNAEEVTV